MSAESHLLIVAPHPDDETLALGGTIYDHHRLGGSAEILAVTDGEAADDRASPAARRELAARRHAERDAALGRLASGGVAVTRLGYRDGALADDELSLERALLDELGRARRSHPHCTVLVPWREDPHPDHEATARAGIRAAAALGLPHLEVPIWAWYHRGWRAALPSVRLRRLDISPEARCAKRAALRCFVSQLELLPGGRGPVLPADFLAAFDRPFEPVLG